MCTHKASFASWQATLQLVGEKSPNPFWKHRKSVINHRIYKRVLPKKREYPNCKKGVEYRIVQYSLHGSPMSAVLDLSGPLRRAMTSTSERITELLTEYRYTAIMLYKLKQDYEPTTNIFCPEIEPYRLNRVLFFFDNDN